MRTPSRRAGFWTAATVAALALWTSAAPTMTYPLYQREWRLTPTSTSVVFAVYPIVLVAVLIFLGDVADHIGRRTTILLGLLAELLGVLAFVLARDVTWILIGRGLMGIGVGLSLSPASAAMVEFSRPEAKKHMGPFTTGVTAIGIALSMLIGGALVQYGPWPLRLDYAVLSAVIILSAIAAWRLPRHMRAETMPRWRPKPVAVPRGQRVTFVTAAFSMATSFIVGAVVLSLGAQIARNLAGSDNASVTAFLLSVFAFAIIAAAVLFARLPVWITITIGGLVSTLAIALYVLCGATHSLGLFFAASAAAGVGYSLTFAGGLTLVNASAPSHHRAGMLSGLYLVGYLSQGAAAPVLGALATAFGIAGALDVAAPAMAALFLTASVLALTTLRRDRALQPLGEPVDSTRTSSVPS